MGRPAKAHNTLQEISLRTRLSKPGEPREGLYKPGEPREGFSLARNLSSRGHFRHRLRFCQGSSQKARQGLQPRGDSFLTKRALSLRQNAHGLCILRRVTGAPARGDDSAAVTTLVYKAVIKTAPSKGATRIAVSVIRRPSAAALQGRRHRGAHPEPQQRQPTDRKSVV